MIKTSDKTALEKLVVELTFAREMDGRLAIYVLVNSISVT